MNKFKIIEPLIIEIGKIADNNNFEVYIVGGYIRDYFLNIPRADFDFTVVGDALKFAEIVADHYNINAVLYGLYHTAMVPIGKFKVEFVGTRKEEYVSNSRNPIVTVGTLEDDLRRRDFTVNAIAASINKENFGEIIDLFDGLNDLNNKILRTPLDAEVTFNDDPLRILRAARFASKLGFGLNTDVIATAGKLSERINILSPERISDELLKILATPKPSIGLRILFEMDILQKILPELTNLSDEDYTDFNGESCHHKDNFDHSLLVIDRVASFSDNIWLRFAALLHDIGKHPTKEIVQGKGYTFHNHPKVGAEMLPLIFKRLRLPLHALDYVAKIIIMHHRPLTLNYDNITDAPFRRLAVDAGNILDDLLILSGCDVSTKNTEDAENHFRKYEIVKQRVLDIQKTDKLNDFHSPVSGNEIIELCNIPPSKFIGTIKNRIEEAIIEGIIPNEYEAAKKYLIDNKDNWISEFVINAIQFVTSKTSKIDEVKIKQVRNIVESINDILILESLGNIQIVKGMKQGISISLAVVSKSKHYKFKNISQLKYLNVIEKLNEAGWDTRQNQKLYIFYKRELVFIAKIDIEKQIITGNEFKGYSDNDILFYSHIQGKFKALANFYPVDIEIDSKKFKSVEHYYQACKATNDEDFNTIANAPDPYICKSLGTSLPNRKDWHEIKYEVMLKGLWAKFSQHKDLQDLLLSTGNGQIHEHTFNDKYWAFFDGIGKDMLGIALMETREKLRIIL